MKHSARYWIGPLLVVVLVAIATFPVGGQALAGIKIGNLCTVMAGTAHPESSVTASICSLYLRSGTAGLFTKESGSSNTGWGQVATVANAVTLTNKTLDAEGTGNVLTIPERLWMHTAICYTTTDAYEDGWWDRTDATGFEPTFACHSGTNTKFGAAEYTESANTLYLYSHVPLAADWTGTLDMRLFWVTPATSGNVVWQLQTACTASAATTDPAWNTANTVTQAAAASANRLSIAAMTSLTTTGCTAGSMLWLRLLRDSTHVSDTLGNTASLIGAELTYRRAM